MSGIKVRSNAEFQKAVTDLLIEYGDEAYEIIQETAKATSREAVSELKATSPRNTGEYAGGWSHRAEKNGRTQYTERVYNRKRPSLTHLLEHGHDVCNGSTADAQPHIGAVEDKYANEFYDKVVAKL